MSSDRDSTAATVERACEWLLAAQQPDGRWVGRLETNCCMEAEWLLMQHVLGVEDDPKREGVIRAVLAAQRDDGSWEVYRGAPAGDINTTVECYAALRACGHAADSPPVARARAWIEAAGGLGGVRVFTRYWLALIGEWPWAATPALPPELIWLPSWAPFNLTSFASWARATIVPLCLLCARRPVRPLPPERRLDELFPGGRERFDYRLPARGGWSPVALFLRLADRALSLYTTLGLTPFRGAARRACREWIVRRQDADGAWGGIQPPWVYATMALHHEGYSLAHPVIAAALAAWDRPAWSYAVGDEVRLQASESPVWDTLLASLALLDAGRRPRDTPALVRALDWVLDRQVRVAGDWTLVNPRLEPGGWAFESYNDHYPDVDDTAVAILLLARLAALEGEPEIDARRERIHAAIERAVAWVRGMQSRNGGWGAFDRDNTSRLLTRIPFCDFGEVIDPPSVDVTAHVLEAFAATGVPASDRAVARALAYVAREQEPEGSWFGRWGVNHVYGCGAVVPALEALEAAPEARARAAVWLAGKQNADGGWGEGCESYMDDALRGVGPSTPSQTGWALLALLAADGDHAEAIDRGLAFLAERQREDGSWDEPQYTGTGFPGYGVGDRLARVELTRRMRQLDQGPELSRGFMLNYNLYRHIFPLMALGRARAAQSGAPDADA